MESIQSVRYLKEPVFLIIKMLPIIQQGNLFAESVSFLPRRDAYELPKLHCFYKFALSYSLKC